MLLIWSRPCSTCDWWSGEFIWTLHSLKGFVLPCPLIFPIPPVSSSVGFPMLWEERVDATPHLELCVPSSFSESTVCHWVSAFVSWCRKKGRSLSEADWIKHCPMKRAEYQQKYLNFISYFRWIVLCFTIGYLYSCFWSVKQCQVWIPTHRVRLLSYQMSPSYS